MTTGKLYTTLLPKWANLRRLLILVLFPVMAANACMTIWNVAENNPTQPRIYGGTRRGIQEIGSGGGSHHIGAPNLKCLKVFMVIDLPFSFVLDTVLLPVTLPWALLEGRDKEARLRDHERLLTALRRGDARAVENLLNQGVRLDERRTSWRAPMHLAVQAGRLNIVELLLKRGVDPAVPDGRRRTPLHYALDSPEIIALLASKGVDINARDSDDRTPLHLAVLGKRLDTARSLLRLGADPNVESRDRKTAVFVAVLTGQRAMLRLLLKYRGDMRIVRGRGVYGRTHLSSLVRTRDVSRVRNLLELGGVDVDARNPDGGTALTTAVYYRRPQMVRVLLRAGANVDIRDKNGRTALGMAERGKNKRMIQLLRRAKARAK